MCLMALSCVAVFGCTKEENNSNSNGTAGGSESEPTVAFVDLGLPSGTKWKDANEKNEADAEHDFFTYDEAVLQFGNNLPSKEQCEELKDECQWSWTGSGYRVTGPNGNSITLPAAGYRFCDGGMSYEGTLGNFWSSTPDGSDYAWSLYFNSVSAYVGFYDRCLGYSVRLVQD